MTTKTTTLVPQTAIQHTLQIGVDPLIGGLDLETRLTLAPVILATSTRITGGGRRTGFGSPARPGRPDSVTAAHPYHAPQDLVARIDALVCDAVRSGVTRGGEIHRFCRICGGTDDHRGRCPVPAMERFIDATDAEVAAS